MKNGDMPVSANNLKAKKIGMAGGRYDGTYVEEYEQVGGLTKREYFAAMAMQGIFARDGRGGLYTESVALTAVEAADELLKALGVDDEDE